MLASLVLSLFLATPPQTADILIVTFPPDEDVDLVLSPSGKAEVRRQVTVSRVKIEVEPIRPATSFAPQLTTFVAWAISPEGFFENIGELQIDRTKGKLESTTRFDQFGILITAEPHYMVDQPSATIAFRNQAPRKTEIRTISVPVQIGLADYSGLPAPAAAAHPRLIQARAAFEIARKVEAERWAEAEFRQARIAIDAMEELLARGTPQPILLSYVNDAIRRAQHAATAAREKKSAVMLTNAEREIDVLKQDRRRLESQVEQAGRQLSAAAGEIQQSQTALEAARRDAQQAARQLEQVREQASASEQAGRAERERLVQQQRDDLVQRLKRAVGALGMVGEESGSLTLTLPDGAFDDARATLKAGTAATLSRLAGILHVIPVNSIRIQGHASYAGPEDHNIRVSTERADAVRQFLIGAGIPEAQVTAEGLGSSRPIGSNDAPEGRIQNRRVEITLRLQ